MKVIVRIWAVLGALIATDAFAQVEVAVEETGRVKTIAKAENAILGATNSVRLKIHFAASILGGKNG